MEDMGTKTNELLAHRLADMLYRLNQGETLDPKQLAEHYRTSVRTVYRDLTERFAYLPIQKVEHGYRLDTSYLGKLDFQDIKHFAALSGVVGMFPSFDRDFLRSCSTVVPVWPMPAKVNHLKMPPYLSIYLNCSSLQLSIACTSALCIKTSAAMSSLTS